MKMKRCLMFAAVMFSAALFGVYGSGNVASAKQDNGNGPPVFVEDDPQVGANAQDMVPRYDGSALVAGTITDDGTGNVSINNSGQLDLGRAGGGLIIPKMTTAARDALAAVNGMIMFNTTTDQFEGYDGTAWVPLSGAGVPPGPFACGVDQVADVDGNLYDTVLIGAQCWMAENLNVGTMIVGTDEQTDNSTIEKYCFDDDLSLCDNTGAFYQWPEMMQYDNVPGIQGICPADWHIPSDTEWKTLEMELGMTQAEADNTSVRGTDQGTQLEQGGTSGFQALLAGTRAAVGQFFSRGLVAAFWSSTESGASASWERKLFLGEAGVSRLLDNKAAGFSVRCVKD